MGIIEMLALAVGLSMDAFSVAICKGLCSKKASFVNMAKCGLWFGGFQALMPLLGFFLASTFAKQIEAFDHWIAFVLLAFIGSNMLKEAFSKEEASCPIDEKDNFSVKTMFTMAIATSVDAIAAGISLAMESVSKDINIALAVALIGIVTCILSALGVKIGAIFGDRFEKKAQILGGVILILLGLKILLEHLGVIAF